MPIPPEQNWQGLSGEVGQHWNAPCKYKRHSSESASSALANSALNSQTATDSASSVSFVKLANGLPSTPITSEQTGRDSQVEWGSMSSRDFLQSLRYKTKTSHHLPGRMQAMSFACCNNPLRNLWAYWIHRPSGQIARIIDSSGRSGGYCGQEEGDGVAIHHNMHQSPLLAPSQSWMWWCSLLWKPHKGGHEVFVTCLFI